MRIYDLAKEIGQKLSIDVKPAKLAEEFKTMPQFAVIHDTIRSHASSVDDEHAEQMVRIYMERHGRKGQPEKTSPPAPAPAQPSMRAAAPQPVRPQPAAPLVAPRQPLPPVRPAAPPRPMPIQPFGAQRTSPPIPAVRRPAPIQAPGAKPAAPSAAPVAPAAPATPAAPVAPPAPVAPVAKAAPAAPVAPVAPKAAVPVVPAPAAPAAPQAAPAPAAEAPAKPAVVVKPVQVTPAQPAAQPQPAPPAQQRMGGAPVAPRPAQGAAARPAHPHPAGARPQQPSAGRPQQGGPRGGNFPKGQKFRPTGLASELKSSSGTTGVTAAPDAEKSVLPRPGAERTAGQPTAPAMPKFSMDSPFLKPPTPRRPEARTERPPRGGAGERGPRSEYSERDRGPRPGGERPMGDRDRGPRSEYVDRGPRPGGERPMGDRGPRSEYVDRGPRPGGERPAGDRGPRPGGERGPRPGGERGPRPAGDRGPRPGGYERRPEGGAPRGKKSEDAPLELTTVPEIGVMKLKPAKRRHGEKVREKGEGEGAAKAKAGIKGKVGGPKTASKVVLKPSKIYGDADEFRRPLKAPSRKLRPTAPPVRHAEPAPKVVGPVVLTGPVTVGAFAEKMSVPVAELIKRAFLKGHAITINQLINFDLAEEIAFDMEIDLQIQLESEETDIADFRKHEDRPEELQSRPPVVTIMGHVDHGKTTLLDYYRRSQVVEGEFGGITQHIGAYHVTTSRGDIVFLDTPGHEAFTSMRARGAQCTDIVVLVVSADDGVMPQTVEAINHAKAAGVPMIVAINKIDLPQANPERVRTELLQYSVVPTSLGGDTEFVEISAKKGINMDTLLEIISLQAEVMELKSNPDRPAEGVVIESHVDPLRGAVATILIQKGTLKGGQIFVVGQESGRVRAMLDDHGRPMEEASPGNPCELVGLSGSPDVGEMLLVMDDERKAREIAERREQRRRLVELGTTRHVTLEGLHDMISEGKIKELDVILKADVQGSIEAISQSLDKLSSQEIRVRVLHSGTGSITESDVNLAMASSAVIIGFNIRPEPGAAELAQREGVEIKHYRIIYELLEDIEKAMVGMLEKKYTEQAQGRTEVRQIFRVSKVGTVAGCYVLTGEIHRNAHCRLIRDGKVVYAGKVASLRRVKDDVSKVAAGFECGVMLEKFSDVKEGDIIETYTLQEVEVELTRQA